MEIWIVSDWHLYHENIIRFSNRPFANAKEMNEALLTYHNELVKPEDHVYNLGDVTMLRGGRIPQELMINLVKKFKGHKRLLLGNHDHFSVETYLRAGFEKIRGPGRWIDGLVFSHYPVHPSSIGRARANLHGHIHDNPSPTPSIFRGYADVWNVDSSSLKGTIQPYINMCVEWTDYRPQTLSQVNERIKRAQENFNG